VPFARRSVALREAALGLDHPEVAADVAALAVLLDGQGLRDEAERLYRRALATFEQTFGDEHYEVAVNLSNLAGLLRSKGDDPEAERLYRRALAMRERLLGPEHPEVALAANNLAVLLKARGDLDEARMCTALGSLDTSITVITATSERQSPGRLPYMDARSSPSRSCRNSARAGVADFASAPIRQKPIGPISTGRATTPWRSELAG
jgi:hypothetical protein